jgi:DNA-binding NarL/FixJ family response regulator
MLKMGVKGYLSKDIEVEDMHAALEAIAQKGYYYSDLVSGIMAKSIQQENQRDQTKAERAGNLSENERRFIKLACTELTYEQIADQMHLSPKTIDGYRENLFHKFKVKNRIGLAMYAVKNGLVELF